MIQKSTRRDFLKQSSALGVAFWVTGSNAWADSKSPMERLNIACIGIDGKGKSDSEDAYKHGNVVAICDIDDSRLGKAALGFPDARKFNDYRDMLDRMAGDIDAVTVSTPDHSHAPAAAMAMHLGKHCFCQKPLTWSISEARVLQDLAKEKGVATQMGNQGTAETGLREAVDVIRSGAIGDAKEVHVWTNRPIWPQGAGRPAGEKPIPKGLHWDLFLGPAPFRPYNEGYQPFKWRGWLDFGTGALGDMACHTTNLPVMALELFDPLTIEAKSSGIVENESYPEWSTIQFEFGSRGARPPVTLYWYDGGDKGTKPPAELFYGEEITNSGSLIVGEKGTLYSPGDYGKSYELLPREKYTDFKAPDPVLPQSPGHFTEFAIACAGGPPAMSNFGYGGKLTETILLGNVALRAGGKVEWDAENMNIKNLPEANQYLKRDYRAGWTL